jgi:hypothetical protein
MEKHITLTAVLHIGYGILGLVFGTAVWMFFSFIGIKTGDEEAMAILGFIGPLVAVVSYIFSVPGIIGGVALLKRRQWGRILTLILSVILLLDIPFGTALGIYSLWVLVQDETKRLFASGPTPAA